MKGRKRRQNKEGKRTMKGVKERDNGRRRE